MKKIIDSLMLSASKFTVWDYGFFKVCLLSIGIILGAYFSIFFIKFMPLIIALFVISYVWMIYRIFFNKK